MFLKTIEIRGFKSFADKTELIFQNGVTSIVGPNGSGKSNISDAVRWVLGEQSVKSLRGGKMEDVIFAGTQFRKPVGLCQVSLTLDNEDKKLPLDYTDITISRRLYRSGESEYYINNTQCRLKDIHELFMDTGIGKEGYSIIGQGKIDAVLSGRPEERRSLLEEAAGIVKFKWRKEEAQKRLENTEANLIRIEDILGTYEERLEPLRIENEKAKEFVKLSEELKKKEINIVVHSVDKIEEKISNIQNSINSMNVNTEQLNTKFAELKAQINKWTEKIEEINLESSNCKKEYYDSKARNQEIEAETKLLGERLDNLTRFVKKSSIDLDETTDKISRLSIDEKVHDKELTELKNRQRELRDKINEHEDNIRNISESIFDKSNLVKKLKDDQIEYLSDISNLKNGILMANSDMDGVKEKIQGIKSSCESYMHSIKINSSTKEMLLKQIKELTYKITEYENEIKNNKKEVANLTSILLTKEKELKDLNNLYTRLEANHNMLINLDKQYEGYNRSVKILMNDIEKEKVNVGKDSCFVLGEIIAVDKRFETAIEVALGGGISDIITKNEDIAKKLIKYLKDNNIGRATFLPLTIIKGKKISGAEQLKRIDGYIGIASELIEYKAIFTNAVEHILGRTIICTDMDSALKIAKQSNYSFKIVTLLGEIVNPGGSLTGGSLHRRNTNIIGRKREIEDISLKIKDIGCKISSYSNGIQQYKESIKRFDEENLNLKDQIYSQNIEITKVKGKINTIDNESSKLTESIKVSNGEVEFLNKKLEDNTKDLDQKRLNLENLSKEQKKNDDYILRLELELKDKNHKIEEEKERLTNIKVKKAQTDENVISKTAVLENLRKDIEELNSKRLSTEGEIKNSKENIDICKEKISKNKEEIKNIDRYIIEIEKKIKDLDVELIKLKSRIKLDNENMENLNLIINKKEEELHKLQLSLTKFTSEKEALYSKLNDELEITYAEALTYKGKIDDIDSYRKEINSLKSSISSLGVVNLGAIDEYKELREKVNFMNTQKEDLINAKEELNDVINEMTEKMKVIFNENFNKLRMNFNETFRELFKGGSADLILTNGDELSGNIDITVQPPGKKLQNINLMSGGEKGLSAIALLFAILKMKPTPFCILDEIEAALDDANVSRYGEFLKKFSQNIQFIVITHRKGTMEASDALYGVTMEEKGISKVVSVDLNEEAS